MEKRLLSETAATANGPRRLVVLVAGSSSDRSGGCEHACAQAYARLLVAVRDGAGSGHPWAS